MHRPAHRRVYTSELACYYASVGRPRTREKNMTDIPRIEIIGVTGLPEIRSGDALSALIATACVDQGTPVAEGDILVVTQKIVSKAEGRLVRLSSVEPSDFACQFAEESGRDPRLIELVMRESYAIVRMAVDRGILITETKHGFVCANAGIDASNVPGEDFVSLLPENPDASARRIQKQLFSVASVSDVAVIISDTFGRAWRDGHVNFAIGVAGMSPLRDYRGTRDVFGHELRVTRIAIADELAAASELVMGKADNTPVAIIRGFPYTQHSGSYRPLIRNKTSDLFR